MCLRNLASFCFEPDENTIRTSKQLANVPGLADRSVRRRPKRWIKGRKGLGYEGHFGFGRQVEGVGKLKSMVGLCYVFVQT